MNGKPLEGIRVLDLSRLLPGPFCTLLLADLGAEVIKVEDLEGGDYIRAWPPFIDGQGAYFLALNAGQKSNSLNLKAPAGREIFLKLASTSASIIYSTVMRSSPTPEAAISSSPQRTALPPKPAETARKQPSPDQETGC